MQRSLISFRRRDIKRKIVLTTGPRFHPHRLDTARKIRNSLAGRFFSTGSTPDGVEIRKASSWLAGLEL